ncbi:NACHT domain-containing protein [Mesorhizobium sp. M0119]|uniref:NACHT domain-containing protein n=1 Tax=Mesorhizobium sp. M0119 TaxID=2956885 RepID=UPI00333B8351
MEANSDLKWSYPDIIRGTDVLQLLIEGTWRDNATQRNQALYSYIASQCKDDDEVKFKQVELQNKILALFVDIPVAPVGDPLLRKTYFTSIGYERGDISTTAVDDEFYMSDNIAANARRYTLNTAATLLRDPSDNGHSCVVIEGAPGQGKSTITQYVCQVNRLKLLGRADELSSAPKAHLDASVRIPFRVDLRDFATWVSGRNPFSADPQLAGVKSTTLESFISAQVSHLSGGQEFTSSDFIAIIRNGRVSIVLDGFDEVADIPTRQKVVEEIMRSAARILAHQRSTQIIVTSRPAAFANSPGFPETEWLHLELQSMTPKQIDEYARKWMAARHLPTRERREFIALLKEKLEQPHMRDLSRNPMQLTILLALIHTRGLSLPDKRTALYDNYMELFFNRESEKSRVVREHRDLLVDIHRYLAWVLHTSAEEGVSGGSISEPELKRILGEYLSTEGHDVGLVQELFTGMVERVVALVARVEGTFEFEVQPLREYFAARHLYETAPYSPPGDERRGTKPERFDALSRNFYWLNVARFYCGCFSRGELSSLVDSLDQLSGEPAYRYLAHPRTLALMLLGDWVFSQQPLLVARVVDGIFRYPGLKILLSASGRTSTSEVALPERCGRSELVIKAYAALDGNMGTEDRASLLRIVRSNTEIIGRTTRWLAEEPRPSEGAGWLEDGRRLGIIDTLPSSKIIELSTRHLDDILPVLVAARRYDVISENKLLFRGATKELLSRVAFIHIGRGNESVTTLELFGLVISGLFYRALISTESVGTARHVINRYIFGSLTVTRETSSDPEILTLSDFVTTALELLEAETSSWKTSLDPWRSLVGALHNATGPSWALYRIAIISAGVKSKQEPGAWSSRGWDDTLQIVDNLRFARLRSRNTKWWREQLGSVTTRLSRQLAALTLAVWASPKTILSLVDDASRLMDSFTTQEWSSVCEAFVETAWANQSRDNVLDMPPPTAGDRLKMVLGHRGGDRYASAVFERYFFEYTGDDEAICLFVGRTAIQMLIRDASLWERYICILKNNRCGRNISAPELDPNRIPLDVAKKICEQAPDFPKFLVRAAQDALASDAGGRVQKVGEISVHDHWF